MSTDLDRRVTSALRRITDTAPTAAASRARFADAIDGFVVVTPARRRRHHPVTLAAAAMASLTLVGVALFTLSHRDAAGPAAPPDLTIRRVEPEHVEGFVFDRAYQLDGLLPVSFGRADPPDASQAYCAWSGESGGCSSGSYPMMEIRSADGRMHGWVWPAVPVEAATVEIVDRHGNSMRQAPVDGIAMFPDPSYIEAGPDGTDDGCDCTFRAFAVDGDLIATADMS